MSRITTKRAKKIFLIGIIITLVTTASWFVIRGFNFSLPSFSKEVYGFSINFNGLNFGFPGLLEEQVIEGNSNSSDSPKQGYGVSASHPLAVEVGMEVLRKGGNAVDAAIAVGYALGVVEPYGSGIGGGGAMLIYPADGREPVIYDYREVFPYSGKTTRGIGVPGFVKGMELVHKEFGTLRLAELIDPSISLAENGFNVHGKLAERIKNAQYRLPTKEAAHLYPGGKPIKKGTVLKQKELAETLIGIKAKGASAFYEGTFAKKLVSKVGWSLNDLKSYSPRKQQPVSGEFAGYTVVSAPAPLGGITLIQSLQMAELLQVNNAKSTADFVHLTGEITKRAYKDRLTQIADTNFVNVPSDTLVSPNYSLELAEDIDVNKLSPIYFLDDTPADLEEHSNTTHFVVVDQSGMMVSTTNTISNYFGSGTYVGGFFLNNQLKNFSSAENSINRPEPGKRPRSYISPTILVKDDKPVLGIGTPGGRKIPAMLAQVLTKHFLLGKDLEEAVQEQRYFIEENKILLEGKMPEDVKTELRKRGYNLVAYPVPEYYGAIQALVVDYETGTIKGIADARKEGTWRADLP